MILSDLASMICGTVGQTDDDSVAACKLYLQRRHEMIWNSRLWRDSIGFGTVSVIANQTYVGAPRDLTKVLCVRESVGMTAMGVTQTEAVLLANPDYFDTANPARSFSPAGSAVAVPTAPGTLSVLSGGAESTDVTFTYCYELSTSAGASNRRIETRTFTSAEFASGTNVLNVAAVLSVHKPVTDWHLEISIGGDILYTMATDEKDAARRARIHLTSPASESVDLLFIGKRAPNRFTEDEDSPSLDGMDNALINFAQGDMLKRARHYSKAQAEFQEGAAHLASLIEQERGQNASVIQITPFVEPSGVSNWTRKDMF